MTLESTAVITNTGAAGILDDGTMAMFPNEDGCIDCCQGEGECGECGDVIGNEITVDLGVTNFVAQLGGYYEDCETPCNDFENEFVLAKVVDHCWWEYEIYPFCSYFPISGRNSPPARAKISAQVEFVDASWWWYVYITFSGSGDGTITLKKVIYRKETTTVCTGKTYTLDKIFDDEPFIQSQIFPLIRNLPCVVDGLGDVGQGLRWPFPETIDLIIP